MKRCCVGEIEREVHEVLSTTGVEMVSPYFCTFAFPLCRLGSIFRTLLMRL